MNNSDIIREIESTKRVFIETRDKCIAEKQEIDRLQQKIAENQEKLKDISDKNSNEYYILSNLIELDKEQCTTVSDSLKQHVAMFADSKQALLNEMRKNLHILEEFQYSKSKEIKPAIKEVESYTVEDREKLDREINRLLAEYKEAESRYQGNDTQESDIHSKELKSNNEYMRVIEEILDEVSIYGEKDEEGKRTIAEIREECEPLLKLKYAALLAGKTPEERIAEYKEAIKYVSEKFSITRIEENIDKLGEILGEQREQSGEREETRTTGTDKAKILFDASTHTYTVLDASGKEIANYDALSKNEDGDYENALSDRIIEEHKKYAKNIAGLSNKEIRAIDFNVLDILIKMDKSGKLRDEYLYAIKDEKDFRYDIEYDFREENKEDKMPKKILGKIKRIANRQRRLGLATIINKRNKIKIPKEKNSRRGKIAAILAALGLTAAAAAIAGKTISDTGLLAPAEKYATIDDDEEHDLSNEVEETENSENNRQNTEKDDNKEIINTENTEKHDNKENTNRENTEEKTDDSRKNDSDKKEKNTEKDTQKEKNDKKTKTQKDNSESGELSVGDYVTISSNSRLYRDPSDSLRIQTGQKPLEKVYIKKSDANKIYQINKEGYYAMDGTYVAITKGEDLEKALKAKGLEKAFINDKGTLKMYHVKADGIAQWVSADDVSKANVKTDRLGNITEIEQNDKDKKQETNDQKINNKDQNKAVDKKETKKYIDENEDTEKYVDSKHTKEWIEQHSDPEEDVNMKGIRDALDEKYNHEQEKSEEVKKYIDENEDPEKYVDSKHTKEWIEQHSDPEEEVIEQIGIEVEVETEQEKEQPSNEQQNTENEPKEVTESEREEILENIQEELQQRTEETTEIQKEINEAIYDQIEIDNEEEER